jgi:hypothetical protein
MEDYMAQIRTDGLFQGDFVSFLTNVVTLGNEIKADFNAVLTKLDTDSELGDTTYSSTLALATADLAIGVIKKDGIHQGDLATLLTNIKTLGNEIRTNHNLLTTKLDADTVASSYDPENDVAAAALDSASLVGTGINWRDCFPFLQAALTLFNELKADLNAIETKLDADTGVNLTTYASGNPVTTADLSLTV